ncbi:hypothetical protein [Parasporobacterium paucivorans]|uniref:Uncharacterized protein n=1 Tax=Parasporobacterium paucivorans DSM 15970 TaxID=1122934 RepID=A0A1M6E9D8_9FIRM|nr:hypothetical protein [Parasporobacterium paucivorans]SHI82106.1 hypothetical protein SAMN02745691_00899 [Parasporobacterium paucivorans DSM 15970]
MTKDVPEGAIVGGNSAWVIDKYEDLLAKRVDADVPPKESIK